MASKTAACPLVVNVRGALAPSVGLSAQPGPARSAGAPALGPPTGLPLDRSCTAVTVGSAAVTVHTSSWPPIAADGAALRSTVTVAPDRLTPRIWVAGGQADR